MMALELDLKYSVTEKSEKFLPPSLDPFVHNPKLKTRGGGEWGGKNEITTFFSEKTQSYPWTRSKKTFSLLKSSNSF